MKKYLIFIPMLLLIIGCSNNYQVSDLKITDVDHVTGYIEGAFKNNTNTTCTAYIHVDVISGTLKFEETLSVHNTKPNEITHIRSYCIQCKNLSDLENVKIKVKEINCY